MVLSQSRSPSPYCTCRSEAGKLPRRTNGSRDSPNGLISSGTDNADREREMLEVRSAASAPSGTLINAPSLGRLVGVVVRGVLLASIVALAATLLFNHFAFTLSWFLPIVASFAGGWALVVVLSSPSEPVLIVTPTTIPVSRWGP